MVFKVNRRDWVFAHFDKDGVSSAEFAPFATVEGDPGAVASVFRDAKFDFDRVGEDDGAEGEGVWANWSHQNSLNVRVNHGTTGGDGVGGGSSGRGEHDAVGLDGGDELPAIVRFDFGEKRGRASVHEDFVEDSIRERRFAVATVFNFVREFKHFAK